MYYSKNFYQIKSNEEIFELVKGEVDEIGYYNLPLQDTSAIKEFSKNVTQKNIAIIGIGGSTLGTYAIYNFLKKAHSYDKTLHFFESTDPMDIKARIKKLELADTLFVVISKSGTTIETISVFKYFASLVKMEPSNCVIVSEDDSKLSDYARKNNLQTFDIPKNVGGRFSVFSAVGLLPLCIVGVDIDRLLGGAKMVKESFFTKKEYYEPTMQKARFMVENKNRFNINVLFSYSSSLEGLNKWYIFFLENS